MRQAPCENVASVYQPLALAWVRASASGDTPPADGPGSPAGGKNAPCAPRLLPLPSAWWDTPAVIARTLSTQPGAARLARRFTRDTLSSWDLDALADEAEIIVSELVANAIMHGMRQSPGRRPPGPVTGRAGARGSGRNGAPLRALRVCLVRRAGEVMLAVIDPSDEAPAPRQPDREGEGGRGLQIVHALSDVWGWSPMDSHGKAVWAVLRCP